MLNNPHPSRQNPPIFPAIDPRLQQGLHFTSEQVVTTQPSPTDSFLHKREWSGQESLVTDNETINPRGLQSSHTYILRSGSDCTNTAQNRRLSFDDAFRIYYDQGDDEDAPGEDGWY